MQGSLVQFCLLHFRKEVFEIKGDGRLEIIEEGPLRVSAKVSTGMAINVAAEKNREQLVA